MRGAKGVRSFHDWLRKQVAANRPWDELAREVLTVDPQNLQALSARDEVKFVLSDREDYEFARDFTRQHRLAGRASSVIFSPAFRKDARGARDSSHCLLDPRLLAEWILADGLNVRLGLQLHKFIWQPETKGV